MAGDQVSLHARLRGWTNAVLALFFLCVIFCVYYIMISFTMTTSKALDKATLNIVEATTSSVGHSIGQRIVSTAFSAFFGGQEPESYLSALEVVPGVSFAW